VKVKDAERAIAFARDILDAVAAKAGMNVVKALEEHKQIPMADGAEAQAVEKAWNDGFNAGIAATNIGVSELDVAQLATAIEQSETSTP